MPKVTIDGKEYEVAAGLTIIQACDQFGIEIPRFCYHSKLAVAGNCRMCLVEVEKFPPKPVPSCNQIMAEGMVVHTNSPMARSARAGVMEFLLINHPLDCPICDQGGECDLQDQAMRYGRDRGDYEEYKRAVPDKYMGPLVATHMTRCIHCTRCVRCFEDIAGSYELGAIGRGEHMEISTYVEKSITSELSGNIIDLCPVGALTSKPYAFKARSWELRKTHSIDVHDAVGCSIRIDSRGGEVMRVLPRTNEEVNECWISDKARFAYDGLLYQRLDSPMIKEGNNFVLASWAEALARIAKHQPSGGDELEEERLDMHPHIYDRKIAAIAGKMTDVETMVVAQDLLKAMGSRRYECRENGSIIGSDYTTMRQRASYIFNTSIAKIEEATTCLLVATNPRYEAAVLNARIHRAVTKHEMKVSLIGDNGSELNYPFEHLGDDIRVLVDIANGVHPYADILEKGQKPMIIIGDDAFVHGQEQCDIEMLKLLNKLGCKTYRSDWNGFNILHKNASRVGGLDIGFTQGGGVKMALQDAEIVILLEADDFDLSLIPNDAFVIYIGHHGDSSIYRANVVLPSPAYTEKSGTYVNLEGRVQRTEEAVPPLGQAKKGWEILLSIARAFGIQLPYNSLDGIRDRMSKINNIFLADNFGKVGSWSNLASVATKSDDSSNESVKNELIHANPSLLGVTNMMGIERFYLADSISRSSKTMSECVRVRCAI